MRWRMDSWSDGTVRTGYIVGVRLMGTVYGWAWRMSHCSTIRWDDRELMDGMVYRTKNVWNGGKMDSNRELSDVLY